jgi:hypothetical protein
MWNFDNPIFDINGRSPEKLTLALNLAFSGRTVEAYKFIPAKGLVLYSYLSSSNKDASRFPAPLNALEVASIVIKWLVSDEAKQVKCVGWDADADHDGDNELGWRIYTEDWGHIEGEWNAIAIKPAYIWYGK